MLGAALDWLGSQIRYGMSPEEKNKLAAGGKLEGKKRKTKTQEEADRYAAGHLFAKQWPRVASAGGQTAADMLHFGPVDQLKRGLHKIPGLKDIIADPDKPELQSWASVGGRDALAELAEKKKRYETSAEGRRASEALNRKVARKPASRY
jgi:hypothetical protein